MTIAWVNPKWVQQPSFSNNSKWDSKCDVCKRGFVWSDSSSAYEKAEGAVVFVLCSEECHEIASQNNMIYDFFNR